jgi:NAD(P)H-hydrate repair Nnr-like enzyme with NAD(P)H-hydrate dehydratase domain
MADTLWQTQNYNKPLYEDLIWNKPEQKSLAGKLLIVGGNSHAINAPSSAYKFAIEQGVGEVKVAMPNKTKKLLGPHIPLGIELLPSTDIGSFSKESTNELLNFASWADATIYVGDFGKNSETAIVLENLIDIAAPQILTLDAIDYFYKNATYVLSKTETLLVITPMQLQKYIQSAKLPYAITSNLDLLQLCTILKELTSKYPISIVTQHHLSIICANEGDIIVTKMPQIDTTWQLKIAVVASVWWLQNPKHPLKAIATAITQIKL